MCGEWERDDLDDDVGVDDGDEEGTRIVRCGSWKVVMMKTTMTTPNEKINTGFVRSLHSRDSKPPRNTIQPKNTNRGKPKYSRNNPNPLRSCTKVFG